MSSIPLEIPVSFRRVQSATLAVALACAALIVGTRDATVGTDTRQYLEDYAEIVLCRCAEGRFEPLFQNVGLALSMMGFTERAYLATLSFAGMLLAVVAAGAIAGAAKRVGYDGQRTRDLVLLLLLLSPFFVSAQINIVRQGIGSLLLISAIGFWMQRRHVVSVIAASLAVGFHYTSAMYLSVLLLSGASAQLILGGTALLGLLYVSGNSEQLVRIVSDLTGLGLYDAVVLFVEWADYRAGVRWDFLAFSIALGLGMLAWIRYRVDEKLRGFAERLVLVYCLLLWPFLVFGFANFANRYAFTAWLFASIVSGVALSGRTPPRVGDGLRFVAVVCSVCIFVVLARLGIQM